MEESRAAAVQELRARFAAGQTRPAEWRAKQLRGVLRMATEMEAEICDALYADVGKPKTEAHVHEVGDARAASYPRNLLRSIIPFSWCSLRSETFLRGFFFSSGSNISLRIRSTGLVNRSEISRFLMALFACFGSQLASW
jgi:hypothetical protein